MNGGLALVGTRRELDADARLTRDVLEGNESAFLRLAARLHPGMVRYATALLDDAASTEAVVLEAWQEILAGLERFDRRRSLRCWMFGVLTRVARRRSAQVAQRAAKTWPSRDRGGTEQDGVESLIRDRICSLDDLERRVVLLSDVEGWSAEEVCSLLGISNRTRRAVLHRARTRIHQALHG